MAGIFGLAKQFCRLASVLLLASSASLSAFAQGTSARVFMFHETKFYDGQVAATSDVYPDNFRDMLEFLARAGYNVIPVSQLVEWHKGNATIPTNAVVLTFDDNYIGNHQYAHPIMQELVMPGTFFAHTGYVGGPTSRDHGTWAQLDFCEKWGLVTCESHTVTHPYLTQTSNLTYELVNSKQAIESNLGKTCRYLAYPFGDYNSTVIAAAQAAGYEAAFTTKGGLNYLTTPRYELNRNGIGIDVTLKGFKSILGYTGSDSGGPIIIDNADSGFTVTGTWSTLGSASSNYGHYGTNYRQANVAATQSATARFTPTLPTTGYYDVFTWYQAPTDPYLNTDRALYRIAHKNGTTTVYVNQRINKACWYYLGRYQFNSGTSGYVEISNQASTGSYVCADAVKFQPVSSTAPTPLANPIIVDNSTSGQFSTTGTWSDSTSGYPYGTNCKVALGSSGAATATASWTATIPRHGVYEIGVWFTTSNATYRSSQVPYTVAAVGGNKTILVNQQDSAGGAKRFVNLGTFRLAAGTYPVVTVSNAIGSSTQYVSADAVRIRWVANAPTFTSDNTSGAAYFATTGTWTVSANAGYYGTNSLIAQAAGGLKTATWKFNLPVAGIYEPSVWWVAASDAYRSTSVPYTITHASGTATVYKNQTTAGSVFNALGQWTFNAGLSVPAVQVSTNIADPNDYVSADAARMTYLGPQ
ncbi:Polysaccharide deacetylase [Candidatus Sumerlaea chitinivorans]|uniref:Polysaccharide deacetylase n=1 Tax=Sumerlaea chitinivorans TaxID=2250252 RepID=A0A2Z4Y2H8_SUMC1|nr:Polysaccharide deacetylase [Candidatus Sumerlaea chitinivorans]